MKADSKAVRAGMLIVGLFAMALGISVSVKADLGVTPISCVPYIYSLNTPFTLGNLTIFMNALFVLVQIAILRRRYSPVQLMQLVAVVILGYCIDFTGVMLSWLHPASYIEQFALMLLSCVLIAAGLFIIIKAHITYIPGDGLMVVMAEALKQDFGKTKIGFDSSMVIFGIASSFVLMHTLVGIREGTVVAALLVGYLIRVYSKGLKRFQRWAHKDETPAEAVVASQNADTVAGVPPFVITIAREYGSGGHEIGQRIAQKLGIAFYDKELINLTAEKSGYTQEYIQEHEQKIAHTLLYELYAQNYAYVDDKLPPTDVLFLVQSKIIREACSQRSCVIVGRCANYILKDNPNSFNVFIYANEAYRKNKIINDYKAGEGFSSRDLEKSDRERANYCLHYTGKDWKDASNYHVCLDSSLYSTEEIARKIINLLPEHFLQQGAVRSVAPERKTGQKRWKLPLGASSSKEQRAR